ncbi:MAG TPA: homocysteine S-methyltransferase family protein [Gaiellales bacterium]|jgi:5-methyltetrahydrofolate--homocysteine methyltransferase
MDFAELVTGPTPALADGAMGTMLFEYGLSFGEAPETWNMLHPELVRRVHRGYLEAGSQVVLTNTFGGNRSRLAMHGLEDRVPELNRTAAVLARSEVEQGGWNALVAGDIGPTGDIFEPLGTLSYDEAVEIFAEQAAALAGGGVDVFWVETLAAVEEGNAALEGIRRVAPDTPVIVTMTFDTHGRTMMGLTPEDACAELARNGARAVGGNCGNGSAEVIAVVERMRAVIPEGVAIVAKANAGIPVLAGDKAQYPGTPADSAEYALAAREAGANLIGGCCGTTFAHVAAMQAALSG